jgi:hypothetical protein
MEEYHRSLLRHNRVVLIEKLVCSTEFLEFLKECGIVMNSHIDDILIAQTPRSMNRFFLDYIVRRGPDAFKALKAACVITNQMEVLLILEESSL